jgi:prepilin-type N-terminal cleavage/methylation domain-containing protein
MTNDERNLARIRSSALISPSTFGIRISLFGASRAFTLIELIVVIAIIVVLAGLILSTMGYVQKKGARARAETEIAAMSAALESYKADNGIYPRDSQTDLLNSTNDGNPAHYSTACRYMYGEVTGDRDFDGATDSGSKSYFTLKPASLLRADMSQPPSSSNQVTGIRDPFGNSYGYSTMMAASGTGGYNPTFDLWSTSGLTTNPPGTGTDTITPQWIKNW